jgi:serine/threonine protein phosphatase PrpC
MNSERADHEPGTDTDALSQQVHSQSAHLVTQCDMDQPLLLTFSGITAALFTRRCPGKETPNEDSAAIIPTGPDSSVLIVADGMGGERSGARASALAVTTLLQSINESSRNRDDLRPAILDGIERANQAIRSLGVGAATTLALVEVTGSMIRPYHVGDSDILLTGQRGRVKLQTTPHSPVGAAVEAGMINPEEAFCHEDRHIVSNVVGAEDMRIEIGSALNMSRRDTLILASDGVFDNLPGTEVIDLIRTGRLDKSAAALVAAASERMAGASEPNHPHAKPDDLTFILVRPHA